MTKFDWHITANHTSSHNFATLASSDLQLSFDNLHPGHGQITWFRVQCIRLESLYSNSLSLRLLCQNRLTLPYTTNSLGHSSIGTLSSHIETPTVCKLMVSDLFHSPNRGIFHLPLTVLIHYRLQEVFSLAKWFWPLPTEFHLLRGTQEIIRKM